MLERRSMPRRRVYLGGVLEMGDRSTLDCLIRDMTTSGARIHCDNTAILPQGVILEITQREQRVEARVVWRASDRCGVSFNAPETGAVILPFTRRGRPR
jgi:hypothetical protein